MNKNNTAELLKKFKEKNFKSFKKCTDCIYYVENYVDDFTVKYYAYGEIKVRPACGHCGNFGFVSHNPAAMCDNYKPKETKLLKDIEKIETKNERLKDSLNEIKNIIKTNIYEGAKLNNVSFAIERILKIVEETEDD